MRATTEIEINPNAAKRIAAVAERMRALCLVRENASRELVRKWAREIEASLKREDA